MSREGSDDKNKHDTRDRKYTRKHKNKEVNKRKSKEEIKTHRGGGENDEKNITYNPARSMTDNFNSSLDLRRLDVRCLSYE